MGQIGNWGSYIVFETSDSHILTFSKMQRKISGDWSTHKTIGQKAKSEFNGPGLQSITFSITLDAALGVRPRAVMEGIVSAVEEGQADYLVIGGRMVGRHPWKCTSASESWDVVYSGGEVARMSVSLTMEEYL